jgi:hypothetical protein
MRILGPIVKPAARFLSIGVTDDFHRSAVGTQLVALSCMDAPGVARGEVI